MGCEASNLPRDAPERGVAISWSALFAGVLASAVVALLLIYPGAVSDPRDRITVAVLIGMPAVGAVIAAFPLPNSHRALLLSLAGAFLIGWGIIGIFSIGLPLLVAGVVAYGAAVRASMGHSKATAVAALAGIPSIGFVFALFWLNTFAS